MTNHPNRGRRTDVFEVVQETSPGEWRVLSRHKTAAAAQKAGLAVVKREHRPSDTPLHVVAYGYGVRHQDLITEINCY